MPIDLTGNKLSSTSIGPKGEVFKQITFDGLLVYLDVANKNSYSGSGINWLDLSGNGRNAFVRGTVTTGSTYNGYFETAANQTSNYIELPESGPQSLSSSYIFTLEWWCTIKDNSSGRYQQSMVNSGGANLFIIGKDATSLSIYNTSIVSGTAPSYTVDVPLHLAVTSDGTNQFFYKNGVYTSTWSAAWGDIKTTAGWIIDQEQDAAKGSFDANQNTYGWWHTVRLYDRKLSESQLKSNYNFEKARFGL